MFEGHVKLSRIACVRRSPCAALDCRRFGYEFTIYRYLRCPLKVAINSHEAPYPCAAGCRACILNYGVHMYIDTEILCDVSLDGYSSMVYVLRSFTLRPALKTHSTYVCKPGLESSRKYKNIILTTFGASNQTHITSFEILRVINMLWCKYAGFYSLSYHCPEGSWSTHPRRALNIRTFTVSISSSRAHRRKNESRTFQVHRYKNSRFDRFLSHL